MNRRILLALTLVICGQALASEAVRVALMDFDCDEANYSHRAAARDFTAALQAQMPKSDGIEWVEREDLARAVEELKLSLAFASTESTAARVGHWAKADWLVLGRFRRGETDKPVLHLEVLSLDHAEVLAEGSVEFQSDARPTYRALISEAAPTTRSLTALLHKAAVKRESGKTQMTVAWLFIGTSTRQPGSDVFMNEGIRRTLASFAPTLTRLAERAAARHKGVRLVRFTRPNRALDESELIVSGLVESDPAASFKIADYYVWGEVVAVGSPYVPGQKLSDRPMLVDLVLHVWDGRTEPRTFREAAQVIGPGGWSEDATEALCERLVRAAIPMERPSPALAPERGFRQQVARMLVERADKIGDVRNISPLAHRPNSPENRRWLGDLVQTLEMACFFDPQNQAAKGKLLSIRWSQMVRISARDPFRFDWQASEAWGRCVESFGLETPFEIRLPMGMVSRWSGGIAWEYVRSVMTVAQRFETWGAVQVDMPNDVRDQWHEKIAAEAVKRVIAVRDRPEMSNRWSGVLSGALSRGARATIPNPHLRLRLIEAIWPRYVEYLNRTKDRSTLPSIQAGVSQTLAEVGRAGAEKAWFDLIDLSAPQTRPSPLSSPLRPWRAKVATVAARP